MTRKHLAVAVLRAALGVGVWWANVTAPTDIRSIPHAVSLTGQPTAAEVGPATNRVVLVVMRGVLA